MKVKAKFQTNLQQMLNKYSCIDDPTLDILWENRGRTVVIRTSAVVFVHTKKKAVIGLMKMTEIQKS